MKKILPRTWMRTGVMAVVLGCGLATLSACVPLMVGGAVMGGLVVSDRRTTGTVVEDEGIELRAGNRIRERLGDRVHINVISYNRQVLLTGEAPSEQDKEQVEKIAAEVEDVRNVVNEIGVMGNSTLTQRSNDAIVTGPVKAALLDARDLFANAFKISTARGTTYVMGRVTEREARRATDVISAQQGVQRVVRILEVISEDELARLHPKPPTPPSTPVQK